MDPIALERWLVGLPEEYLTYIEWLLDKTEEELDNFLMEESKYRQANELIERIQNDLRNSGKTSSE